MLRFFSLKNAILTALLISFLSIIDAIGVFALVPIIDPNDTKITSATAAIKVLFQVSLTPVQLAMLIAVSSGLARIALNYVVTAKSEDARRIISTSLLKYLSNINLYDFKRQNKEDLNKKIITDVDNVMNYRIRPFLTIFAFGSSLILILIFLFIADWKITAISATILILIYLLIFVGLRKTFSLLGKKQSILNAKRFEFIDIFYDKYEKLQSTNNAKLIWEHFDLTGKNLVRVNTMNTVYASSPKYLIEMILLMTILLFLNFNGNKLSLNQIETFSIFGIGVMKVLPLIQGIYQSYVNIKFGKQSHLEVNNIFLLSQRLPISETDNDRFKSLRVSGQVCLQDDTLLNSFEICLDVGKCYFVQGASGSGKTTLLNCLSQLDDRNSSTYCNEDYVTVRPKILFQTLNNRLLSYDLLDDLTSLCAQNCSEDQIHSLLKELGFENTKIKSMFQSQNVGKELSAGQTQRIELAQSLLFDADIYLLDEPFSNLDANTTEHIVNFLAEWSKNHSSIFVIVSHTKLNNEMRKQVETITIEGGNVIQRNS